MVITRKKLIREASRFSFLVTGFFLMALGIVVVIETNLGVRPWDVLHLGFYERLQIITLGQVIQGLGLLLVLVSLFLGVRPNVGTVLNMLFIGFFVDVIYFLDFVNISEGLFLRYSLLLLGTFLTGVGTSMYMSMNLGAGPRDSLMLGLSRKAKLNMGLMRTFMEVSVTVIGYILGGPLGIGTVIGAFSIGFFMQMGFRFLTWVQMTNHYRSLALWLTDEGRPEWPAPVKIGGIEKK